jgi:hypothetical protein
VIADPARHFPDDYSTGRERFLAAAADRGAQITGHSLDVRGPRSEELAVDAAYLGPEVPARVVAVSSGIHGAEGYAGSAIQHQLLAEQLDDLELPSDTGLLLVHALNPFGFAHTRRVNESNVDLNRNFLRHPDEHVPNPDYDELAEHVNPERLDEQSDTEHRSALFAWGERHGFSRLQEVLTCGQYQHPAGVQFGGLRDEASNRILRELARRETRGARRVAWVDVHTGLGAYGGVEMITEAELDDPAYRRGRAWYGERARSTRSGESVSAPLNGVMECGLRECLDPEIELTVFGAEFGTYDPIRVFQVMRADNWLRHHGELDSEQGRAIRAELLEVFRPADSLWQRRVLELGARVIGWTRDGLLGEAG